VAGDLIRNIRFENFALAEPDRLAVVDPDGSRRTRGEILLRSNKLVNALRARGLGQVGATVAVAAPNCAAMLTIYHAVTRMGMYLVPINWHLTADEVAHVLSSCAPVLLIIHERLSALAEALPRMASVHCHRVLSIGVLPGIQSLEEFTSGHSQNMAYPTIPGRALFYSSGTTGRPKAVKHTLEGAQLAIDRQAQFQISQGIEPDAGHSHLCATMLYHQGGMQSASTAFHMGHAVVLMDRWDPENMLQLIQTNAVTTTTMVPVMFSRLLRLPERVRQSCNVSSLKQVLHGSAPCPVHVKQAMIDWWGPVLWEYYCGTEGQATTVSSHEWLQNRGTVGKPYPGVDIRILDSEGNELPRGECGEIYIRQSSGWQFEYLGAPEHTLAGRRGEYFTLGDIGYLNDEGYLFINDRKSDVINCGGEKIFSIELEQILLQHPAVADCAVLGVPDELFGEAVRAVIQPLPGNSPGALLTEQIMSFLRGRLAATKLPRRVEYCEALPRGPNGKVYKKLLRAGHDGRAR